MKNAPALINNAFLSSFLLSIKYVVNFAIIPNTNPITNPRSANHAL